MYQIVFWLFIRFFFHSVSSLRSIKIFNLPWKLNTELLPFSSTYVNMSVSRTKSLFNLIVPGLFLALLSPIQAQTSKRIAKSVQQESSKPVRLESDSSDFDAKTGLSVAKGHVVLTYGKIKLYADRANFDSNTKQAHAEGHVRLLEGYKELKSDTLDYNFETGATKTGVARAELEHGIFFQGESMESKDREHFVIKNSYITTSDYDKPGYRLKTSSIDFYPQNRIVLHDLVLYVGSVPVFYFPILVWALDDDDYNGFNSGTQIQIGSKGNWGFFILNSYATRVSESFRPTYHLDYREQRGLAGGVDFRYKSGETFDPQNPNNKKEFEPSISGKVRTYFADDLAVAHQQNVQVVTSTTTTTQNIKRERYQVKMSQHVDLREDVYSKLKVNKFSDINFQEDFFEKEFQRDPQPDSFFEITKWSPNTTLSLLARPQLNNFFTTTERLPEIRYDLKRQPILGGPFFYEGENSFASLSKKISNLDSPSLTDYEANRLDTFHQILYPKQYFGWLSVVPRVGARATFYDKSPISSKEPAIVRGVFNTGFETSFKATRTWNHIQDKKWEIDGLRHIIEPSVNYGYVMKPNRQPNEIYQFDVQEPSSGITENLTPIDFPQYTGIDSIDKRNVIRPAIRQRLQTKRDGSAWNLGELLIYQDIVLEKGAADKTPADLFAEFAANPTRWLSLGWRGRYDENNDQIRESNTSFSIFSKKTWKLTLSHLYFRGQGNQLGFDFAWAMNEDWTFRTTHRFDPSRGDLFEQAYALDRDFHSWIATFAVSELRPLNREEDLRVWVAFTLKAFPEVAFDSRQIGGNQ
jgi:LPS-assembly protein